MIINLLRHAVRIIDEKGNIIKEFPASNLPDKLISSGEIEKIGVIDGVPISKTSYEEYDRLPQYESGNYYIVDEQTRDVCCRIDLLCPKMEIVNEKGEVLGYRYLDTTTSPGFLPGLTKEN